MPSGAKKRKAAKKKKEMAVPHQPDSPTDRPHGNGERESGSEEEGERSMESHGVEGAENGAGEQHREEIKEVMGSDEVGDVAVEAIEVVEVVEVEEKPEPEKEEAVVVPIVQVGSVNEEVLEAIEGLAKEADAAVEAVVLRETVEKTAVAKESEEVMVVAVPEKISELPSESGERLAEKVRESPMESPEDTAVAVPEKIGERPSESDERLPETKSREIPGTAEAAPAPLVAHRASLWNCCGLLEVFSGSQR